MRSTTRSEPHGPSIVPSRPTTGTFQIRSRAMTRGMRGSASISSTPSADVMVPVTLNVLPAGTSTISKRPSVPENASCPVACTLTSTAASGAPVRASTMVPVTRLVTGCGDESNCNDRTRAIHRGISKMVDRD